MKSESRVLHKPGPPQRHTGQFMVLADWSMVAAQADGGVDENPDNWPAFKQDVEVTMMAYFTDKFPARALLVVCREFGATLVTAKLTAHEKGRFYSFETAPRRIKSDALCPHVQLRMGFS